MLSQMRTFARSWLAYLLLFVLAVAFAIWGVNDVFSGVGSQNVAQVGGRSVSPVQLTRELQLTLRAQRQQGNNISQEEAIAAGLHTRLLDGMITRLALYAYGERLGVSASDAQVAERIRQIPSVNNPVSGGFDETAYAAFLTEMGYNRSEFENDVRGDITTQMLMEAMVAGLRAPSSYGALVLAYESEQRTVSIAEAPLSAAGRIPPPTEAQLQAFYEENEAALRVPEFRQLTLVYARPSDFVSRVNIPDERLREEFESHRDSLSTPERRTYTRITAQNEEQANQIAARLGRGENPNAIATALGAQIVRGENQLRSEVADSRVAEAVFAAPAGAAQVVRGQLSPWVVVRVDAITAATTPNFEAARDRLRQELTLDEAGDLLNTAIGVFEDARAGGASVAEAARQAGLPTTTLPPINDHGDVAEGGHTEALDGQDDLVAAAFQTPEGEATDFLPLGDAEVMISVDRIIPASVRPFAQVEGELRAGWIVREQMRRLRELGDEVRAAVAGGQSFAAAARARGLNVVISSRATDRRSATQIPARGLAAQIFQAREGEIVTDMRVDGGALLVAQVEGIQRVNPAEAPQAAEAARGQAQQSLTQSLAESLQAEIVRRAEPRRNDQLIERLFRSGDSEPQ